MQILIGGAPGTGSSVLVQTLNRHPALLAGPETFMFIHPRLYNDFPSYRSYLLRSSIWGGLKSIGWFRFNGAMLRDPFYGWHIRESELRNRLRGASGFPEFANQYFQPALERNQARIWVEKSPSNVLAFTEFLAHFPEGKIIHTLRNPFDNIASLMARGYSAYYATGAVLVNQAFGLRVQNERVHRIKYEKLVTRTREEMETLFQFLEIPFDPGILEVPETETAAEMAGWELSERAPIGSASLGRFEHLPEPRQAEILAAVAHLRIRPGYADKYELSVRSVADLCSQLVYPMRKLPKASPKLPLHLAALGDRLPRMVRLYPTGWSNYPLIVK